MNNNPLLSIVVPTKNRYKYLKKLIELFVLSDFKRTELVIQDNSDDNSEILSYLENIPNSNIKYYYKSEHLSVSENSGNAISNSSGEYVCFLGDDDGFCKNIEVVVAKLHKDGIDAALFPLVVYNWPDFYDTSLFRLMSTILLEKDINSYSNECIPLKSSIELRKCLNNGFLNLGKMPKVYQGIVSRKSLDKVYEVCGSFFPGSSPDMGNAVALSLLDVNCVYYDMPVIISGQGRTVGAGERLSGRNQLASISEKPFLPSNIDDLWSPHLPKYWCSETIWPQSAFETFNIMNESTSKFKWNLILARFAALHHAYYNEAKQFCNNRFLLNYYMFKILFVKGFRFFLNRFVYKISKNKRTLNNVFIREVDDILAASQVLS